MDTLTTRTVKNTIHVALGILRNHQQNNNYWTSSIDTPLDLSNMYAGINYIHVMDEDKG